MQKHPVEEILKMSKVESINAVKTIWDSIEDESQKSEISDELKSLLNHRIKSYEKNPEAVLSWKVVKAEFLSMRKK